MEANENICHVSVQLVSRLKLQKAYSIYNIGANQRQSHLRWFQIYKKHILYWYFVNFNRCGRNLVWEKGVTPLPFDPVWIRQEYVQKHGAKW